MIFTFLKFAKTQDPLDNLRLDFYLISKLLPNYSTIGFFTNMDNDHETLYYYQSQFILSPRVLVKDGYRVEMLLLEDISRPVKHIENSRKIFSYTKENFRISLLKRFP